PPAGRRRGDREHLLRPGHPRSDGAADHQSGRPGDGDADRPGSAQGQGQEDRCRHVQQLRFRRHKRLCDLQEGRLTWPRLRPAAPPSLTGADRKIRAGEYEVPSGASLATVVGLLVDGKSVRHGRLGLHRREGDGHRLRTARGGGRLHQPPASGDAAGERPDHRLRRDQGAAAGARHPAVGAAQADAVEHLSDRRPAADAHRQSGRRGAEGRAEPAALGVRLLRRRRHGRPRLRPHLSGASAERGALARDRAPQGRPDGGGNRAGDSVGGRKDLAVPPPDGRPQGAGAVGLDDHARHSAGRGGRTRLQLRFGRGIPAPDRRRRLPGMGRCARQPLRQPGRPGRKGAGRGARRPVRHRLAGRPRRGRQMPRRRRAGLHPAAEPGRTAPPSGDAFSGRRGCDRAPGRQRQGRNRALRRVRLCAGDRSGSGQRQGGRSAVRGSAGQGRLAGRQRRQSDAGDERPQFTRRNGSPASGGTGAGRRRYDGRGALRQRPPVPHVPGGGCDDAGQRRLLRLQQCGRRALRFLQRGDLSGAGRDAGPAAVAADATGCAGTDGGGALRRLAEGYAHAGLDLGGQLFGVPVGQAHAAAGEGLADLGRVRRAVDAVGVARQVDPD
uniref:Carbamoyl-phosphate synthase (glutamine-hydrolyzing) n=1 Tax=Parastrongyloides trichosuri TaxID=131310 RepID=A0A0N4Z3T7_PARTI